MDLYEAMTTGGSPRAFTSDPVSEAVLLRILDQARFAPSGANQQGWHVIIVREPAIRAALRDLYQPGWREYATLRRRGLVPFAADEQGIVRLPTGLAQARETEQPSPFVDHLDEAPVLLVLCTDLTLTSFMDIESDRPSIVGGASIYPLAQNIVLAARAEGLGGLFTTIICRAENEVRDLLQVPGTFAVAGLMALGAPTKRLTRLTRRPVESFTTVDRFDGPAFPTSTP